MPPTAHGRRQPGYAPVARQSNLLVEVSDAVTDEALKKRLLELVQAEGRPFGLRFEDIQGGFTLTGRNIPNASTSSRSWCTASSPTAPRSWSGASI